MRLNCFLCQKIESHEYTNLYMVATLYMYTFVRMSVHSSTCSLTFTSKLCLNIFYALPQIVTVNYVLTSKISSIRLSISTPSFVTAP